MAVSLVVPIMLASSEWVRARGSRVPGPDGAALLARTPLHAARLELAHPSGAPLAIEAPLPEDLARTLAALRGG